MNKLANKTQDEILISEVLHPSREEGKQERNSSPIFIWDKKFVRPEGYAQFTLEIIRDKEGRIQWLFPINNLFPVHTTETAGITQEVSKTKKYISRIVFSSGLGALRGKEQLTLLYEEEPLLLTEIYRISHHSFAILFNYESNMERAHVILTQRNDPSYIMKIPLSPKALTYHLREKENLEKLSHTQIRKTTIPIVLTTSQKDICVNKIYYTSDSHKPDSFTTLHVECLLELYRLPKKTDTSLATFIRELDRQIGEVRAYYDHTLILIKELFGYIKENPFLPTGWANGNFIPEQLEVLPNQININNWERSSPEYPLFFDWFQFHYHTSVSTDLLTRAQNVVATYPVILEKWHEALPLHSLHVCYALHFLLNEIDGILITNPAKEIQLYSLSELSSWLKYLLSKVQDEGNEFNITMDNDMSYQI
ncbi:MAG: hypothetical protein AAF655_08335 [Bacteroidota bacterium]